MFLVLSFPFPSFLYVCVRTLFVVTLAGNYLYSTFLLIQFLIVAIYALVLCIVSSLKCIVSSTDKSNKYRVI